MKNLIKKYLSGGSLLLLAIFLVNIINFVFNAYLGRVLSFEAFGLVALINTMWYVMIIFLSALSVTVNQRSAYLIAQSGTTAGVEFVKATNKRVLWLTVGLSCVWLAAIPFLDSFFQIHDSLIPLLFTPMITLGALVASDKGFLQGNFNFLSVAIIIVLEALAKLLFAWVLVISNQEYWVYASIPLSVCLSFILAFWLTSQASSVLTGSRIKSGMTGRIKYAFPRRFFTAALVTGFASMAFLTFDVLLAKHYLSPEAAGQYALLALIGKMVYFFGTLPAVLIVSYVSKDRGNNADPRAGFYKIFSATVVFSIGGFLTLGLLGNPIVPFLLGQKTVVILPYLMNYSAAIALLAISATLISYHLVKQQYLFPYLSILMAILMSAGIVLNHATISQIISVIFSVSILSFFSVVTLHLLETFKVPIVMRYMKAL